MTVETLVRTKTFLGNDSATSFPCDFTALAEADLVVTHIASDDTETVLSLNTDYSLSGIGFNDMAVIAYPLSGDPLATGDSLRVERQTGLLQELDLVRGRAFNAENVEHALDRAILALQDFQGLALSEALTDSIIIGTNAQPYSDKLYALANLTWAADKLLRLTGTGTLATQDFTSLAQTLAAIATQANFRSAIGLGAVATLGAPDNDDLSNDGTDVALRKNAKAYSDAVSIGVNQTWQELSGSRAHSTSYQNTTGKPIFVVITNNSGSNVRNVQVSTDNSTWVDVGQTSGDRATTAFIVPDGHYYRVNGAILIVYWSELR